MLIRFCWRMTLPSFSMPLLIDCLSSCPLTCWEGRSEDSSCNCRFVRCSFRSSLYFTYFAALLFGAYTFKIAMSSYGFILCHRVMAIPVAGHFLCLKFIWYWHSHSCFPSIRTNISFSVLLLSTCLHCYFEVRFSQAAYDRVTFFNPLCPSLSFR